MQRKKEIYTFRNDTCLVKGSNIAYGSKLKDIILKPLIIKNKEIDEQQNRLSKNVVKRFCCSMSYKSPLTICVD